MPDFRIVVLGLPKYITDEELRDKLEYCSSSRAQMDIKIIRRRKTGAALKAFVEIQLNNESEAEIFAKDIGLENWDENMYAQIDRQYSMIC